MDDYDFPNRKLKIKKKKNLTVKNSIQFKWYFYSLTSYPAVSHTHLVHFF